MNWAGNYLSGISRLINISFHRCARGGIAVDILLRIHGRYRSDLVSNQLFNFTLDFILFNSFNQKIIESLLIDSPVTASTHFMTFPLYTGDEYLFEYHSELMNGGSSVRTNNFRYYFELYRNQNRMWFTPLISFRFNPRIQDTNNISSLSFLVRSSCVTDRTNIQTQINVHSS